MDWLIEDISATLKSWGHAGGTGGEIILKSDGERAMLAVRNAVVKYHGGIVIPKSPAKGEKAGTGLLKKQERPFENSYARSYPRSNMG